MPPSPLKRDTAPWTLSALEDAMATLAPPASASFAAEKPMPEEPLMINKYWSFKWSHRVTIIDSFSLPDVILVDEQAVYAYIGWKNWLVSGVKYNVIFL